MNITSIVRSLFFATIFSLVFVSSTKAGYDPTIGRWLSRDPIAETGGLNLYGYVDNQPIRLIDPLGLIDSLDATAATQGPAALPQAALDAIAETAAAQAERKAAEEALKQLAKQCVRASEKELKKHWKDIHKAKDLLKKQFGKELQRDKNFDVMFDKAGNVVLKGNKSGTIVPTNLPPSAFAP